VLRSTTGQRWYGVPADDVKIGQPAVAVFTPAAVAVFADPPQGSPRNVFALTVAELDTRGTAIRVRAEAQADGAPGVAADVTPEAVADLRLVPGARFWFAVKAQEVAVHGAHRRPATIEASG
jgi:molybdate transport system ATP-binding protein